MKYSNSELIEILKELGNELGRTPTMHDMMKRPGGPYPSLYQRRFSVWGCKNDGWNKAIKQAGFKPNRVKVDQNEDYCAVCGLNGHSHSNGRLLRWVKTEEILCNSCYHKRYYQEHKAGN